MLNVTNGKSSRWRMVLSLIPAMWLGACAQEPSEPPADPGVPVTARIVDNQTGEIREVTGTVDVAALERAANEAEKAGCVHIRFCSTTFNDGIANRPNTVVCDTNDQVCSSNARFSECNGDAQFVCGRTRPMGFDPGIPCPISGVSFCPAGATLIWISG